MYRAFSIHIGVNDPQEGVTCPPLEHSEESAWRMAELANRAGYDGLLVLRGREATCQAVDDALGDAARTLHAGDTLLVSFSGHGTLVPDRDHERGHKRDEANGWDEALCLYDGIMLDDKLAGFWRLFAAGVRIVMVAESCFSGDILRLVEEDRGERGEDVEEEPVLRSAGPTRDGSEPEPGTGRAASCIGEAPADTYGIQATVLLLAACTEEQKAQDGLYTEKLLEVWNGGAFQNSYCDLHARVRRKVMCAGVRQEPQIVMLGAPDPCFPLETAFHLDRRTLRHPPVSR
jgi:hypothetical protein